MRRLQCFDPGLSRLFPCSACFRILPKHEFVELQVRRATGFGNQVPFDRLDGIRRNAAAGDENLRETVLRDRVAFACCFLQQHSGGPLILVDAGAIEQRNGVFDFGIRILSIKP